MYKILLLKLTSGEEIIAKAVGETVDDYIFDDIRVLMMSPVGQGQMGVTMVPWLLGLPEANEVPIRKTDVMFITKDLPPNLEKGYLSNVSRIQLD